MSLQTLWQQHGTKILGSLTAGLGVLAVATPAEFAMWGINGHTALRVTVIASGLLTVLRGFTNSAPAAAPPPAAPPPSSKP